MVKERIKKIKKEYFNKVVKNRVFNVGYIVKCGVKIDKVNFVIFTLFSSKTVYISLFKTL